jgi:hypothetical protein
MKCVLISARVLRTLHSATLVKALHNETNGTRVVLLSVDVATGDISIVTDIEFRTL